jgi:uncharacterized membrane protein HdeD (DUF308 family)
MSTAPDGWHFIGTQEIKSSWTWFLGVGIALVILGLFALSWSVATTLVSIEIFGWLLLLSGILAIAHAIVRRRSGGFFIELFAGILYIVVGLMVVGNPASSAAVLTLLIAMFLLVGGIFRIVSALTVRFHHRVWMLLNGIVSAVLGILIWRQWPWSGLWVIGTFIGIDLIFYGWSLVMLGLTAKNLPEQAA